jgi:hypothetical protein
MEIHPALKINYLCPECRSYLRVWNNIIFTVKYHSNKKQGLLLLNPDLGNYDLIHHASMKFDEGELVEFFCPVCHADLTAYEINKNLAYVLMIDENDKEYHVFFSKICGEKSTFKIKENDIVERYGEDSSAYVNYFMSRFKKEEKKEQ